MAFVTAIEKKLRHSLRTIGVIDKKFIYKISIYLFKLWVSGNLFLESYKHDDKEREPQRVVNAPENFTCLVKGKTLYVCVHMIKYHKLGSEDKSNIYHTKSLRLKIPRQWHQQIFSLVKTNISF